MFWGDDMMDIALDKGAEEEVQQQVLRTSLLVVLYWTTGDKSTVMLSLN